MYNSFNGDFRRKPKVNIRGSNKGESKQELVERARQERQKREAARLQHASAIKIQSLYRGYVSRRRTRNDLRRQFDASSQGNIKVLANQLLIFFDPVEDGDRISSLCQAFVMTRSSVLEEVFSSQTSEWPLRIGRLVKAAVVYMARSSGQGTIAQALRFVEIYSSKGTYEGRRDGSDSVIAIIYKYLMRENYFGYLRELCDARVPPLLEETTRPPTPLAEAVLSMITRPLSIINSRPVDQSVGEMGMIGLSKSFFARPFSEQVELFVLPSLASSSFPYQFFVDVLAKRHLDITNDDPSSAASLMFSLLKLGKGRSSTDAVFLDYLDVLCELTKLLLEIKGVYGHLGAHGEELDSDDDSDADGEKNDVRGEGGAPVTRGAADECKRVARESFEMLNDKDYALHTMNLSALQTDDVALRTLCKFCHHLLMVHPLALHKFRLLYTLAFRPRFLHRLWSLVLRTRRTALFGNSVVPLLTIISRGIRITDSEMDEVVPVLAVFAALFGYLLVTIHDTEFYGDSTQPQGSAEFSSASSDDVSGSTNQIRRHEVWMPFTLSELVPMSLALRDVTIGLVELAFPETRPVVRADYQLAVRSVRSEPSEDRRQRTNSPQVWTHLFRTTVLLVRQLYTRDTRRQFCPDDHWISDRITLPLDRTNDISLRRSRLRQYRPFQGLRVFTREELVEEGPPLSAKEVRLAMVLREMPYAVSFNQRVLVFHNMVQRSKDEYQGEAVNFDLEHGKQIHAHVRRNFIYEDAFEKLSRENEPELRLKMRIQLVNVAGMDEAGIDGGGLFREFMTELLKTSFDPNRGFFRLTTDQQLYPNPSVETIEPNFVPHYYFIGRMLGKALYENMLVELPLAGFFLSKLLGQKSVNVDIDHLSSLDPELYKNLLYLKNYEGDVKDLELDFTMVSEEIGKTQVEDLKPNGSSIVVNNENRIEYIHLVADFKLNRQIRTQCNAFRQGLSDVVNLDWLRIFSHKELQVLISGADHEIDVDELRNYTSYGNGFDSDHPTVVTFWKVCSEMTEEQKRKLLKFVTSCSRPPLLGFKELDPRFCIQNAGSDPERLPTASTCMNLLKLPDFRDESTLRTKLLYAIEALAGFELS